MQEAALVRAAQGGDQAALSALYRQYKSLVHGILLAHVPPCDVEDLMQDVFVKMMKRLSSLREPAAFSGWLITITRRTASDYRRSRRPVAELCEYWAKRTQPDREASAILSIIQQLPESYRETLVLRFVEGMTGPEIAARTGLTPDSVRVNLCRGAKLLRTQLQSRNRL